MKYKIIRTETADAHIRKIILFDRVIYGNPFQQTGNHMRLYQIVSGLIF